MSSLPIDKAEDKIDADEPATFTDWIKADLNRAADDMANPVWKRGNASGISIAVMLATAILDGQKVIGAPDIAGLPELLARISVCRLGSAKAKHFESHFQKLARVYGPANAALDTARREWAKREG